MLTLRQLRHMQAVARHGSIHRAAEQLHITQPALTRSLATLEEILGVRLFDRSKSGMQATEFCLGIQQRCEQLLLEAAELEREAGLYRSLESGHLCIGFGRALRDLVLRNVLPRFVSQHPGIRLELVDGTPDELSVGLVGRRFDLLIAGYMSYAGMEGLKCEQLRSYAMAVYVRGDHPLVGRTRMSLADLMRYPMISPTMLSDAHPFRREVAAVSELNVQVLGGDYSVLWPVLASSDCWMVAPEHECVEELADGRLAVLDVAGWTLTSELSVIELQGRSRSPAAQRFIELCEDLLP
ncbi:pca operon transcription factor PcaQ [compost metagenome]